MLRILRVLAAIGAFTLCQTAHAQDALDRVDPARIEDRKTEELESRPAVRPAIEREDRSAIVSSGTIEVGAIALVGLESLSQAEFADVVEPYLGRTLTTEDLGVLTDRLAERARATFPLATVLIEPQTMRAGILSVRIDEGRVDAIELTEYRSAALEATLSRLVTGKPVRASQLETQLQRAGDLDGVTIQEARIVRENDRNILRINASYQKARGQITLDNDSSTPIGPLEVFGSVSIHGIADDDDSLQLFGLLSLPQPDELGFLRVRYDNRISSDGTELSVAGSYSRTMPGSFLAPFAIEGQSLWGSLAVTKPLQRTRNSSSWIEGSLSYRRVRQDRAGSIAREDRLTVAKLRLTGNAAITGGVLRASGVLSQGIDILGATRPGDPLASRNDADGTFTALWLSAQWVRPLSAKLKIDIGVRSQIASEPLLVSEELGMGGAVFGRGYDYSERSGDRGTMAYAELLYKIDKKMGPVRGVELYGFGDGGTVRNLRDGTGGGTLFSAGGGVRADVDRRTDASLEVAVPLSAVRYDTGDHTPRIRFLITRYF